MYTRAQLADLLGVPQRTVRYWTTQGILPPGNGSNRWTTYDNRHVQIGLAYKRWQEQYRMSAADFRERMRPLLGAP